MALRKAIEKGELRSSEDPQRLAALLVDGWEGRRRGLRPSKTTNRSTFSSTTRLRLLKG